jgi:hypothetical protein
MEEWVENLEDTSDQVKKDSARLLEQKAAYTERREKIRVDRGSGGVCM